jgi:putative membrane protein
MGELTKASTELVDGTSQLLDGATEFRDYLLQYTEGVDAVGTGIQSMNDGLTAFNEQSTALSTGAAMLQSGLTSLNDALPENWLAELQQIELAAQTIQNVNSTASEVRSELTEIDLDALETSATEQSRTQAREVLSAALDDLDLTDEQMALLKERFDENLALIDASGIADEAMNCLESAEEKLANLSMTDNDGASIETDTILAATKTLAVIQENIAPLQSVSTQLTDGLQAFNQGIAQLYQGSVSLNNGMHTLSEAGAALDTGYASLINGMEALLEGVQTFDEEGIQNLAKLAGEDLEEVLLRLQAVKEADQLYKKFSGTDEDIKESVRFVIETDEIKKVD